MSETIRNLQDIIEKLERYETSNKNKLDALKKIEFPTKKDGSEFAVFSKNFTNCRITGDSFYPKLEYDYRDGNGSWTYDWLSIYEFVDAMKEGDPRKEKANPKQSCLRQTYNLTVAEVQNEIQRAIERTEQNIIRYQREKEIAKQIYPKFEKQFAEIHEQLEKLNNDDTATLFYAFNDLASEIIRWGIRK